VTSRQGSGKKRRTRRPGRVVAIVAIVGAAPLASLWFVGHSLATRTKGRVAPASSAVSTPVLSVRRAAATLVTDVTIRNLRNELSGLVSKLPDASCLRVDANGSTAVARQSDKSLIPASNTKILTAAVVLDAFAPDTRFITKAVGEVVNGTIAGDLVLVGGGDPLLVTKDFLPSEKYPTTTPTYLDDLADRIKAAGITSIGGSVVGDESFLDDTRYNADWSSGVRAAEAGPLGALMVNDGVVVGDPLKPDNPAVGAAREFTRLLRARGITVSGEARSGSAGPTTSEIARIESAVIDKVVAEMLTNSDNNTAEILVRQLGLAKSLQPTTSAGLKVIVETLKKWGIEGLKLRDGSGLSRNNRISCNAIVAVLDRQPVNGNLVEGLSIAAKTGTLADAFKGSAVAGKLHGKTGTLLNVKTLSGVLPIGTNGGVTFALFLNGAGWADQGNYRPLWDALGTAIATYPQGPTKSQVGVIGG
jgi:D-alanyl-D-alanine carboxypeptidase/D-alanyl-D-alanine-endopeptidase (penicillin-binding protein 4)